MDATLYPYACYLCDAPGTAWAPGLLCNDCAETLLEIAEDANAAAFGHEGGFAEATCAVCAAPFRAEADYETRCGECQRAHEDAAAAEHAATRLAVELEAACRHAAEMGRLAAMTPAERAAYWDAHEAEANDVQQALLAAD